ncbi:MAG: DNA phosphorothioation-associated putative methyltransferase [Okeania sp. SIO3I5]|uniref:DNA phosphorothioation-associated putative methyltransferase n=1 Tax=Okeania sp. SIO3I5 TaxID=2607805 RepID=UPI0013BE6DE1|nr:DNA phosphorothioation-associated putative methyltransferase [Okeania sp. SIO3I5]NEQ34862.1 DNA phosphorothioation-associated putative methyltransferase [Okeania sp. SIO3I5]
MKNELYLQKKSYSDLLLYLTLNIEDFQISPKIKLETDLPQKVRDDIKTYFCTYKSACQFANQIFLEIYKPGAIKKYCKQSKIGKKLPTAFYIHISALEELHPLLRLYENLAQRLYFQAVSREKADGKIATLIKFNFDKPTISYLHYPDFDIDAHPALKTSISINMNDGKIDQRNYSNSKNPPVLHRKETFVTPEYPHYKKFAQLTSAEVKLGLLDNTRLIGTRKGWLTHLKNHGIEIKEHDVIQHTIEMPIPQIERHKAAIIRRRISKPVRLAVQANLFTEGRTFFDYGCGYGEDIKYIAEKGHLSAGWDPYYLPEAPCVAADIVNISYVINVIESLTERREALIKSWELTKQVLIVSALVLVDDSKTEGKLGYGDGIITTRKTFQKYYEQQELKCYIDQVLNVDSIPIDLGIFFVFRDEAEAQNYLANRLKTHLYTPRISCKNKRFEDYQDQLIPLMNFMSDRGRLPIREELAEETDLIAEFGTFRRAFQLILQVTNYQEWDKITDKRRQDLLVYLALTKFGRRPKFSQFSETVRNDIRALFGSYTKACTLADLMLFSLSKSDLISKCCKNSLIGYKSANSLLVHVSAVAKLDPLLRLYEGCANRTIGRLSEVNIVKFHHKLPIISYLFYPEFDTEAHPILHTTMNIDLRDLSVSYEDYTNEYNPPILHRKDALVTPDYPHYEKFAKLTVQEEDRGLLNDLKQIQNRLGWLKCLEENCTEIKGHRIYWRTNVDPYQLKILKSADAARKRRRKQ